jgi:hypothetical protein
MVHVQHFVLKEMLLLEVIKFEVGTDATAVTRSECSRAAHIATGNSTFYKVFTTARKRKNAYQKAGVLPSFSPTNLL